jgi:hypothetical protein
MGSNVISNISNISEKRCKLSKKVLAGPVACQPTP